MMVHEQHKNISTSEKTDGPRRQWAIILALSVAATLGLVLIIVGYAKYGESFVRRRDDSFGDMLMREGKRLEEALRDDEALVVYERALKARFNGAANRTYTLERAGALLWRQGRYEEAAGCFTRALEGPKSSMMPYEGLVDSLIHLDRLDEARQRLAAWNEALPASGDAGESAKIGYASGQLKEAEGDVKGAMDLYAQCVAQHDSALSAARLGVLFQESGEPDKALSYLDKYFLLGAPGPDNAALQSLYSRLARENAGP